jgi:serine/threonine protein kinase
LAGATLLKVSCASLFAVVAGVGTSAYRAPEQGQEGKSYDQMADIFSLGIILFEMWHLPFSTGMHRVLALSALREKQVKYAWFAC